MAAALPAAVRAQQWQVHTGARASAQVDDNPNLLSSRGRSLSTGVLAGSLSAVRSSETAQTRADGDLSLSSTERSNGQRLNGRLALRQALSAPRHSGSAGLSVQREDTLAAPTTASDVQIGPASRTTVETHAAWSHALHERLNVQVQGRRSATRFGDGAAAGSDYQARTLSGGLDWQAGETRSLGLDLSRTVQTLARQGPRSTVSGFRLAASQTLSERASLSLSAGRYTTQRQFQLSRLACPLPVAYCQAGLVRYVLVQTHERSRSSELQYSASGSLRLGQTSQLAAGLSRSLTPGGLGVSRDDALSLSASRAWSERSDAVLSLAQSRSRPVGAADAAPARLWTLALSGTHRLDTAWTLSGSVQHRRFDPAPPYSGAHSNQISISLQYQAVTLPR